ncbi:WUSCHEL-related homeobox 9-like [Trifolium medium]|uniref:WUSCHEL-related homeobox 9-like n=1 Tax=Trifolium medium TaxID=97028 RepID=A0A392Q209_9FABA|nr:WUSCHEL-related homeobox 9-like [Trifolium medium]
MIECILGIVETGVAARSMVFINDVAFEVASGPFNVRQAFGDDAILVNSTGQPVLTNQWGVTLHSLQHGACYYVIIW